MSKDAVKLALIGALVGVPIAARAQDDTPSPLIEGNLLNLSFTGDGTTPSAMSRFMAMDRTASVPRSAVLASDRGDATYSINVDLPPALLSPALSLHYSSAGGDHTFVSRGWSLTVGMTIERVTGPAASHAYADLPDVHRISGGGLDGILFPVGTNSAAIDWQYVSTNGLGVHATYANFVWTIEHDGVTTTLVPDATVAWGGWIQPTEWHPTTMRDVSGNTVVFEWSGNRLESIEYGGSTGPTGGQLGLPTTRIEFGWECRTPTPAIEACQPSQLDSFAARDGHVDRITKRLGSIAIYGEPFALSSARTYDLDYSTVDRDRMLTSVSVSDDTSSVLLASFSYARYPTDLEPVERENGRASEDDDGFALAFIGASVNHDDMDVEGGFRTSQGGLFDLTGDGLVDAGTSVTDYGDDERFTWNEGQPEWTAADLEASASFGSSAIVRCDLERTVDVGVHRTLDVDGDGILDDIISTADVPDSYIVGQLTPFTPSWLCDDDRLDDGAEWTIVYGATSGATEEATPMAPVSFPSRAVPPGVNWRSDYASYPRWRDSEGATVDMLDVDGDGWQDILSIVPDNEPSSTCLRADGVCHEVLVWYHEGYRQGGFEGPFSLTNAASPLRQLASSLATSSQHEVRKDLDLDALVGWQQRSYMVSEMRLVRAFMDINGDGLVDFVDATAWNVALKSWKVYLGTGARDSKAFAATPILWGSARAYISRTEEGTPGTVACVPNRDNNGDLTTLVVHNFLGPDTRGGGDDPLGGSFSDPAGASGLSEDFFPDDNCDPGMFDCGNSEAGFDADGGNEQSYGTYPISSTAENPRVPPIDIGSGGGFTEGAVLKDSGGHRFAINCSAFDGNEDLQRVGLIDMDGDGRVDLVDAKQHFWWRNMGAGFSAASTLPDWFPLALHGSHAFQTSVTNGMEPVPGSDPLDYVVSSAASRYETRAVIDVNRDGMPDSVDALDYWDHDRDDKVMVTYGPRATAGQVVIDDGHTVDPAFVATGSARPGLLIRVTGPHGATTELAYASSATMAPSGDDSSLPQQMSSHRDVVVGVHVRDPVTGMGGQTAYTYRDGVCSGGVCEGFGEREITVLTHDPAVDDRDYLRYLSHTETTYLLGRDYQLPLVSTIANHDNPGVDGHRFLWWDEEVRTNTYQPVPFGAVTTQWLSQTQTEEIPSAVGEDNRVFRDTFRRDAFGNVLEAQHLVEGCAEAPVRFGAAQSIARKPTNLRCRMHHEDELRVVTTWVANATVDAQKSLFVPQTITTYGRPELGGGWVTVEKGEFAYDSDPPAYGQARVSAGLLSGQRVQSGVGNALASEHLDWVFQRDERGALIHAEGPGQRMTDTTWTFGGALPETVTNGEGHDVIHEYDAFGRENATTDPNGVVTRSDLDVLGRVLISSVTVDGAEYPTDVHSYVDGLNARVNSVHTNFTPDGDASYSAAFTNLDGFGDPLQTWSPSEHPGEWVVSETLRDIFGNEVRTSWPHREPAVLPFAASRESRFLGWTVRDLWGRARETWEDHTSGKGRVDTTYDPVGWSKETDATGHTRILHTDTLGRLIGVQEGYRLLLPTQTGTWEYDAANRVTELVDAKLDTFAYVYDGAGRLRSVGRAAGHGATAGSTNGTGWYAYEYGDGPDPLRMFEGVVGSGSSPVARWTYDSIGRTETKEVLNRTTGGYDTFTWGWDVDPDDADNGWIGSRRFVSDPKGRVDYRYDAETFGRMGHLTSVKRTWTDGTVAAFASTYDFDGNALSTQWPDLHTVQSTYADGGGWLVHQDIAVGSTVKASLDYEYDEFGLPSGWTGAATGHGSFDASTARAAPTRVDGLSWAMPNGTTQGVTYAWREDGLLNQRNVSGYGAVTYDYDALRRVASVTGPSGPLETYSYDAVNNLTSMYRAGEGTWAYDAATFSEVPRRVRA